MSDTTLRDWIENFKSGSYRTETRAAQIQAGWFDWFCDDHLLARKTIRMGNIISKIKPGGKLDLDYTGVWFQNNCRVVGGLYDAFSFCRSWDDERIFLITIDEPKASSKYTVYYGLDNYRIVFSCKNYRALIKWLNTPKFDARAKFKVGDTVVYYSKLKCELGVVKSIVYENLQNTPVYLVNYNTSDNAFRTDEEDMHKIKNEYAFDITRKKCE